MHVRCPDCRQSIQADANESFRNLSCAACGTVFNLVGDETVEYRPESQVRVGHFDLRERIGSGAFGCVWKAHDTALDRTVAIKMPHAGELNSQQTEQFLREARASACLKHASIVSVHEVGNDQGAVYIVMDYIHGSTLADQLARGPSTPREAAQLCRKVAEAIDYAHQTGVIHRDLKPSNILLDTDGEPHISDFGLAKRTAEDITLTYDGTILGSPAYMSPEQARGEGSRVDGRTDVYSLGVILFELLTGERPFRGNLRMILNQVIQADVPSPRSLNGRIPRDLETICLKCLEKDPRRRYKTAAALADDLQRFLAGEVILARPTPTTTRVGRWCRRNWVAASLSAGLVATLTAGLAATSTQWARAERNAAREAALRVEVEKLTRKLLQLAKRIKTHEAELSRGVGLTAGSGGTRSRALKTPARAALTFDMQTDSDRRSAVVETLGRESPEASELRGQMQGTLRRLERLAPGIADDYRELAW